MSSDPKEDLHDPDVSHVARPGVKRTLADFLDGYIGVLDSSEFAPGKSRLSEQSGRTFAEDLLEKQAQGRL